MRGGLLLLIAWMAVTLLPVSHLLPFRELLAEHYLYIPMMGVALIASGVAEAAQRAVGDREEFSPSSPNGRRGGGSGSTGKATNSKITL